MRDGQSVSVIIPALNAEATIAEQLEALSAQRYADPWEVIVVDNGSSDQTVPLCLGYESRLPHLRVVSCPTPGTSAARNMGAALSEAEMLLFCDADDAVAPGWLAAMSKALERYDAVGGRIENDKLNDPRLPLPRHPDCLPVVAGFLPRAITANLGVRRNVFERLGGFAVDYDYGGPDTEFCWRLQLAQNTLGYEPGAVVHYRHRQTLKAVAVKAYRTGASRGRLYRDFAHHGMARPRVAGVLYRWAELMARMPVALVSRRQRWHWVEQASAAAGRCAGSVRYRVPYL